MFHTGQGYDLSCILNDGHVTMMAMKADIAFAVSMVNPFISKVGPLH